MEFSMQQIDKYIICFIIFSIVYMIIYSKKGADKSLYGYIKALANCLVYGVLAIFIIVGVFFAKVGLENQQYNVLIVPVGWFILIYFVIKKLLKSDFNLNIHILNIKPKKLKKIEAQMPYAFFFIGFGFATIMIFFQALPDTENQSYGPIPIFIVGVIFAIITIFFGYKLYIGIDFKKKIQFNTKNISYLFYAIPILFGILFLIIGMSDTMDYKEKEKEYLEVKGEYIGARKDNNNKNYNNKSKTTYFLDYIYIVDGVNYIVSTSYSTSNIPKQGSEKTILYNPNNPSEAIIKESKIWVFLLAGMFIIIPLIMMKSQFNKKIEVHSSVRD